MRNGNKGQIQRLKAPPENKNIALSYEKEYLFITFRRLISCEEFILSKYEEFTSRSGL